MSSQIPARLLVILILVPALGGCGQSVNDPLGGLAALVANREAGSLSLIRDSDPPGVANDLVQVGQRPNQLLARGDEVLVVNTQSHGLTVVGIEELAVRRSYGLGDGCGPRMMALAPDDSLLVTCFQSNELLRVDPDRENGADPVVARLSMPEGGALLPFQPEVFGQARPLALAVIGHRAYVTLTNLDADLVETGPGLVLVVDLASWTADKIVALTAVHPLAMHRPPGGELIYISTLPGLVEVVDGARDEVVASVQLDSVPGRIWQGQDGTVWVTDQAGGRLMRFASGSRQILDPVVLCPERDPVLDVATNGRGRVYASCFASDTVWTFLAGDPESSAEGLAVGDGPGALLVVQK